MPIWMHCLTILTEYFHKLNFDENRGQKNTNFSATDKEIFMKVKFQLTRFLFITM